MKTRIAIMVAMTMILGIGVAQSPAATQPASASAPFSPGYIISDALFYDSDAMTAAEIQSFLDAQIGSCLNANCLNVKRVDSTARAADPMCSAFSAATNERASALIYRVQQACGISARVLLVTLQKEQSLVTHREPSDSRLDRAMGYACPDNPDRPGWCDPSFGGLSNQIYRAAWQMKRYANPPGTSNFFTWYPVGATVAVRYHPNSACGASNVYIQNQATAALYYYTPYQPNAAALANLYGTGDSCSAYGNRNFWRIFRDWFGDPTGQVNPIGFLETVSAPAPAQLRVRGWTLDYDTIDSLTVRISVDGIVQELVADRSRSDVRRAYPSHTGNYGYDITLDVAPGPREVCVTAVNIGFGVDTSFGCRVVTVSAPPAEEPAPTEVGAVYRFWSDVYQGHFYTHSVSERNRVMVNYPSVWRYEGVRFGAFGEQVEGTVPVFRFWSATFNGHFYTTSEGERDRVIANYPDAIWRYEKVAFYAYPASSTMEGTIAVYRFWSPTFKHHFYTSSAAEAERVRANYPPSIWTYEGEVFRVSAETPLESPLP